VDIGAYEYQPPTLLARLVDGTLTILDVHPSGMPNQMTVLLSGADLVITDANEQFGSAPSGGTLSDQGRTLTIPSGLGHFAGHRSGRRRRPVDHRLRRRQSDPGGRT
jgi:hypothetical protein